METLKDSKIVLLDSAKTTKTLPIIATFQNANLNQEIASHSICKRVETSSDGKKYALIATESSIYKADLTDADNAYQDTYIVIHNKKSKEVSLIQVENASFKHAVYDEAGSCFQQNILDSSKVLAKNFAGKKGAISYERSQRTKVNSSILEDTIDKMMSNDAAEKFFEKDILEQSQEECDKFQAYIFPKISSKSTDGKGVREIFTINNLIGDEIIEHLSEIAIDILNVDPNNLPFTNKYIRNVVTLIQNSKQPDSPENLKKMVMLIYAESLISLINSRKKFINNADLLKFSNQLVEEIMKKFFIGGSRQVSNFTKQKSIVFYGILTLLSSENLEVSLSDILDNVELSKKELLKFLSVVGCKTKGDTLYIHKVSSLGKDANFEVPLMKGKKDKKK